MSQKSMEFYKGQGEFHSIIPLSQVNVWDKYKNNTGKYGTRSTSQQMKSLVCYLSRTGWVWGRRLSYRQTGNYDAIKLLGASINHVTERRFTKFPFYYRVRKRILSPYNNIHSNVFRVLCKKNETGFFKHCFNITYDYAH